MHAKFRRKVALVGRQGAESTHPVQRNVRFVRPPRQSGYGFVVASRGSDG